MGVGRGEREGSGEGEGVETPEDVAVAVPSLGGLPVEEKEGSTGVGVVLALPLSAVDPVGGDVGLIAPVPVALTEGDWGGESVDLGVGEETAEAEAAGERMLAPELLGVPAVGVGVPAAAGAPAPPCGESVAEVEKLASLTVTVALRVGTSGVALGGPEAEGEGVPPPKMCVGLAPTL